MHIVKIEASDTLSMRHEILRPKSDISECIFEGDEDKTTVHLGAIENSTVVGIVSIYKRTCLNFSEGVGFQLRAMSTSSGTRGRGFGNKLLKAAEDYAKDEGANYVWANARSVAIGFYKKSGYSIESSEFEIEGVGAHYLIGKSLA